MLLAEDAKCVLSPWIRGIVETISFYSVSGINDQQVPSFCFQFVSHMLSERDVVTPVRAERWFKQMTGVPAMGVRCVYEVEVTQLEVS